MCMKNINMNAVFCDIVSDPDNLSLSLGDIGKHFYIVNEDTQREISQLSMAIFISATQSKDADIIQKIDPDQVFDFREKYEIKIRLTETISGSFKDLDKFIITPSSSSDSEGLCKNTFNCTRLCLYQNVLLPSSQEREKFVIKLLIRRFIESRTQDDNWIVQSIHPIEFHNIK